MSSTGAVVAAFRQRAERQMIDALREAHAFRPTEPFP